MLQSTVVPPLTLTWPLYWLKVWHICRRSFIFNGSPWQKYNLIKLPQIVPPKCTARHESGGMLSKPMQSISGRVPPACGVTRSRARIPFTGHQCRTSIG